MSLPGHRLEALVESDVALTLARAVVASDACDWSAERRERGAADLAREARRIAALCIAGDSQDELALISATGTVGKGLAARATATGRATGLERVLVAALWCDRVRSRHEGALNHSNAYPVVALPRIIVADQLIPAMSRELVVRERTDDAVVLNAHGDLVGHVASQDGHPTLATVSDGLALFGTVPGNRLLRVLLRRAHAAVEAGSHDSRTISFAGGWRDLADAIQYRTRDYGPLRQLANAGQSVRFIAPDVGPAPLWRWSYRYCSRGRAAELAFTLSDALMPGFVVAMKATRNQSVTARLGRRLVPELRYQPPVGTLRQRDHGKAWTLHRLLILEMVDRATEMIIDGGVTIAPSRFSELARRAGLSLRVVPAVIAAWKEGESETAPSMIAEVERDRFRLSDAHALEQRFIEDGGRQRIAGRAAGLKAAAQRACRVRSRQS